MFHDRQRPTGPRTRSQSRAQRFDFGGMDEQHTQANQNAANPNQPGVPEANVRLGHGRLCEPFTGSNPLIHVEDWMALFTLVTRRLSEDERIEALGRHLSGEAMRWLIREVIPLVEHLTWTQISNRMIRRFRRATHSFFNDALDRELKPDEGVESFFNEKRRLMSLANIDESNQVAMLTRGITNTFMRTQIAGHMPEDPDAWLQIALVIEANMKRNHSRDDRRTRAAGQSSHLVEDDPSSPSTFSSSNSMANNRNSNSDDRRTGSRPDFSRPPTTPCPLCKFLNRREFHWKKDCPNLRLLNAAQGQQSTSSASRTSSAPSRESSVSTSTASASTDSTVNTLHVSPNEFLWFDITVNGHRVRALLDSGSSITCMSRDMANRLNLIWDSGRSLILKHVDGLAHTLGVITADVSLNGHQLSTPIHVLERLGPDMLIGVSLARSADLRVHFTRDSFVNQSTDHLISALHSSNFLEIVCEMPSRPISDLIEPVPKVFAQDSSDFGRIPEHNSEISLISESQPFHEQLSSMCTSEEPGVPQLVLQLEDMNTCSEPGPLTSAQSEIDLKSRKNPIVIDDPILSEFRDLNQLVLQPLLVSDAIKSQIQETGSSRSFRDNAFRHFVQSCHAFQINKPINCSALSSTEPEITASELISEDIRFPTTGLTDGLPFT